MTKSGSSPWRLGCAVAFGLFALASGCDESAAKWPVDASDLARDAAFDGGDGELQPWTIAVLPDTQFSHYHNPSFFIAETKWIAENSRRENIAFVLHEGDIVDLPADSSQWLTAQAAMASLDGIVPYVLAVGNHDVGAVAGQARSTLLNQYFPFDTLATTPTFGGAFEAGHRENAYYLLHGGDRDWLVLALEFSPRPEVLLWADGVLAQYSTTPAIVLTHAYLYSDGSRYDFSGHYCGYTCTNENPGNASSQCWDPVCYLSDGSDGETIWNSLIKTHGNVLFVFSGHVANAAPFDAARLSSVRADGTVCHQMLANYQSDGTTNGDGYFRLVRIWPNGRVQVRTFSPYVDPARANLTEDRNQFVLQIKLPNL
jgi:hypothetical protein